MGDHQIFSVYEKLCDYISLNNNSSSANSTVTDFNNDIFKILYEYSTSKNKKELLENATNLFNFSDRIKYGFPISKEEYLNSNGEITNKIRKLTR